MTHLRFYWQEPDEEHRTSLLRLQLGDEPADDDPVVIAQGVPANPGLVRKLIEQANRPDVAPDLWQHTTSIWPSAELAQLRGIKAVAEIVVHTWLSVPDGGDAVEALRTPLANLADLVNGGDL